MKQDPDIISHVVLPELEQFSAKDEVPSERQKSRKALLGQYRAACQVALRPLLEELQELRSLKAEITRLVQ